MRGVLVKNNRGRRGFTLIELLVVILILAILAALIVPRVIGRTGEAKVAKAKTDITSLSNALQQFKLDTDRYPSTEEGLEALRSAPADLEGKWKGPYVQRALPADPWGYQYEYTYPGTTGDTPSIVSRGSDGAPGGEGDAMDISSDEN